MTTKKRIALGADEAAFELKEKIKEHLQQEYGSTAEILDFGIHGTDPVDYPDIAEKVALAITHGEADRGILLCGTGIGMAITANKIPGIRAAQVHDHYSAERASKSNDAHIISIGARVVGPELAKSIADAWLRSEFTGGPSEEKIRKIMSVEQRNAVPSPEAGK
ncbi:ribose 5-phosphate isomerase B [Paenarthrobacter sp. NyZ202]|uniref:ribose 5-phosphate isomerase B n=1 Tax=Paenarthrobacter sp. NyZ202 TaxID=3402689 RepID=UPI003CEB359D